MSAVGALGKEKKAAVPKESKVLASIPASRSTHVRPAVADAGPCVLC